MLIDPYVIIREIQRPHVEKGAAWLDENCPGWISKVVPDDLQLSSSDLCVCGQLFGGFSERPVEVYDAETYGFQVHQDVIACGRTESKGWWYWEWAFVNPDRCGEDVGTLGYKALDALWLEEIWWRCEDRFQLNNQGLPSTLLNVKE